MEVFHQHRQLPVRVMFSLVVHLNIELEMQFYYTVVQVLRLRMEEAQHLVQEVFLQIVNQQ
jgi:hypothetical protein